MEISTAPWAAGRARRPGRGADGGRRGRRVRRLRAGRAGAERPDRRGRPGHPARRGARGRRSAHASTASSRATPPASPRSTRSSGAWPSGPIGEGEIVQAGIGHRRTGRRAGVHEVAVTLPRRQIAVGRLKAGERVDVFVTYDDRTASVVRGAQVVQIGAEDDGSLTSDREISLVVAVPSGEAVAAARARAAHRRRHRRPVHLRRRVERRPAASTRATRRHATDDRRRGASDGGRSVRRARRRAGPIAVVPGGGSLGDVGDAADRVREGDVASRRCGSAFGPGRGYSALLVDDSLPGVDRDLVELAREAGCAVLIVDSGRGVAAVGRAGRLGAARRHLRARRAAPGAPAGGDARSPAPSARPPPPATEATPTGFRGRLVAVTGAPGTGRSTIAAALAQGLASDPRHTDLVCLADLALHADQAMLHGSPDVVPGLHRAGRGPPIRRAVDRRRPRRSRGTSPTRGYHLLLGLRRHRDWTAVRPRAFAAALDGLRRGFRIVVADVDADVEGEQATGSVDVEERNAIARTTIVGRRPRARGRATRA